MTTPPTPSPAWDQIRSVFGQVLDAAAPERMALLKRLCAGDANLEREVSSLLIASAYDHSDAAGARLGEQPGDMIGRYRLLERIGEGGFGVVFKAEQTEPVRRFVAIKIIRVGMDTDQVVARFEHERQALAMMDHPNIARVLDAGATSAGRPYFVMELVHGEPITQFCERPTHPPHPPGPLPMRARLSLFTDVCNAVQHAHAKGVIHRDIKPNNVLVTMVDGKPVCKVIDFGIAKAITSRDPRTAEETAFTENRALLGTPQYMSPEQAGAADVDTRSDVYSLGVLLYELLTGTPPFDAAELRSAAFAEVQRIIREVDPPKPSTRVSTLPRTAGRRTGGTTVTSASAAPAHTAASGSATHSAPGASTSSPPTDSTAADTGGVPDRDSSKLARNLKGDLDWIVMKAMEKDRARRYDTPSVFAADIGRYLSGEPVLAAPPSALYRLRKLVKRRKSAAIAVSAVSAALVLGMAGTTLGLLTARRERDDAVKARQDESVQRQRALEEAGKYRASSDFLRDMISTAGPGGDTGREVTLRDLLDAGSIAIDAGSLRAKPDVEATVRLAIGQSYSYLGQREPAERHLTRALAIREEISGRRTPEVAQALTSLAHLLSENREHVQAEKLASEAVEIFRAVAPDHHDFWPALQALGVAMGFNQKREAGEAILEESVAVAARIHGENSPEAADARAVTISYLHDRTKSEEMARKALEGYRKAFGPKHPEVAKALGLLAVQLHMKRNFDEAERLYQEALDLTVELFGPRHPDVVQASYMSAWVAESKGDYGAAIERWERTVEYTTLVYGPTSSRVPEGWNRLAITCNKAGDWRRAMKAYGSGLAFYDTAGVSPDATLANILVSLATLECDDSQWERAAVLCRRVLELTPEQLPTAATYQRPSARSLLGECLSRAGDAAGAEPLLLDGYTGLKEVKTAYQDEYVLSAAIRLMRHFQRRDAAEPGKGFDAQALEWRSKALEQRGKLDMSKPWNQRFKDI